MGSMAASDAKYHRAFTRLRARALANAPCAIAAPPADRSRTKSRIHFDHRASTARDSDDHQEPERSSYSVILGSSRRFRKIERPFGERLPTRLSANVVGDSLRLVVAREMEIGADLEAEYGRRRRSDPGTCRSNRPAPRASNAARRRPSRRKRAVRRRGARTGMKVCQP